MKAAVLYGPNDLRVEDRPRPRPGPGEALVRVVASGLCSSDVNRIRAADVPNLPLVPGHEFSGVVAEMGDGADNLTGTRVAVYPLLWCGECPSCCHSLYECCERYSYHGSRIDGGMAEFVVTRVDNLVQLPNGVSDEEGAMSEPAAVALHALNRAGLKEGESVAVIGAGTIGVIAAQIARARGAASVVMLDVIEEKLKLARELGFDNVVRSDATDVVEKVRDRLDGAGPDIVLEAAGRSPTYNLAIDIADRSSWVVWMGNIDGDLTVPQQRVSSILRKQLRIIGTWNSSIVLPENEWAAVHTMVAERRIDLARLISHRFRLEELPKAVEMMSEKREPYQKVMINVPD
jgi:L-iditol 2-dehydrogenase